MNKILAMIMLTIYSIWAVSCSEDPAREAVKADPDGGADTDTDGDADGDMDTDADGDSDGDDEPASNSDIEPPEITGTEYYIDDVNGNDDNSGTSPEEAWQTTEKLGGGGFVPGGGGTVKSGDGVRFIRGGEWEVSNGLAVPSGVVYTTYGDESLPRPLIKGSGSVRGGATLDGLAFKGTSGTQGISVSGSDNIVQNCEVDGSDGFFQLGFGIMGEGNLIIGNYVHDLSGMSGDSGDMNTSGGAEAYMVMASDNEIAYNSAVNCWGPNETLGGAEGGCYEIVNGSAESTIENVYFHHNYCERSVGLFEGCSGNFSGEDAIQEHHGIIKDSYVAYNLSVDAMWLYLLQPVNTDFVNFVFEHNTLVHTPVNDDIPQQGTSSFGLLVNTDAGYTFELKPGDITVRNNLFAVVDGGGSSMFSPPPDGDHYNNLFSPSGPGNLDSDSIEASDPGLTADWRLAANSPAIDSGSSEAWQKWTDFDGNDIPCGSAPDIGALEYCE